MDKQLKKKQEIGRLAKEADIAEARYGKAYQAWEAVQALSCFDLDASIAGDLAGIREKLGAIMAVFEESASRATTEWDKATAKE